MTTDAPWHDPLQAFRDHPAHPRLAAEHGLETAWWEAVLVVQAVLDAYPSVDEVFLEGRLVDDETVHSLITLALVHGGQWRTMARDEKLPEWALARDEGRVLAWAIEAVDDLTQEGWSVRDHRALLDRLEATPLERTTVALLGIRGAPTVNAVLQAMTLDQSTPTTKTPGLKTRL